jgi:hypothetical protein
VSECAVFCEVSPGMAEGAMSLKCVAKLCVRRDDAFLCV